MDRLLFATNNPDKVREMQSAVGDLYKIQGLREAGILIDIPEPHATLQANASEKSWCIHQLTGLGCFSEDTGLEVEALNGEPGVHSARYAGGDQSYEKNTDKLLENLTGKINRRARFHTVISLILEGREYFFEGICPGEISEKKKGSGGFGYDPVFVPQGSIRSFAEMTMEEKNQYSHRKKAADKLIDFLKTHKPVI